MANKVGATASSNRRLILLADGVDLNYNLLVFKSDVSDIQRTRMRLAIRDFKLQNQGMWNIDGISLMLEKKFGLVAVKFFDNGIGNLFDVNDIIPLNKEFEKYQEAEAVLVEINKIQYTLNELISSGVAKRADLSVVILEDHLEKLMKVYKDLGGLEGDTLAKTYSSKTEEESPTAY